MLDCAYSYCRGQKAVSPEHKSHAKKCMAFYFDTEVNGRRYFMEMTELNHNLYVVKFYPKHLMQSDKKFNIIANDHNAFRVLATCIQILLNELLVAKPQSSFLFHGVPKLAKAKDALTIADYNNTQRFKIYKYAIVNRLGSQTFELEHDPILSLMCVLRRNQVTDEFKDYVYNVAKALTSELGVDPSFTTVEF